MSLLDYLPDNPDRPPDWRWQLAARLLRDDRRLPRRWADPALADTLAVQRHLAHDPKKGRPPGPLPARLADMGAATDLSAAASRRHTQ